MDKMGGSGSAAVTKGCASVVAWLQRLSRATSAHTTVTFPRLAGFRIRPSTRLILHQLLCLGPLYNEVASYRSLLHLNPARV